MQASLPATLGLRTIQGGKLHLLVVSVKQETQGTGLRSDALNLEVWATSCKRQATPGKGPRQTSIQSQPQGLISVQANKMYAMFARLALTRNPIVRGLAQL